MFITSPKHHRMRLLDILLPSDELSSRAEEFVIVGKTTPLFSKVIVFELPVDRPSKQLSFCILVTKGKLMILIDVPIQLTKEFFSFKIF